MSRFGRLAASVAVACVAIGWAPREAHADDDVLVAFAVVGVVLCAGADVTFTAYSSGVAARVEEPDQAWMTAQSIVTTPQAFGGNIGMAAVAAEDDDEGFTLLALPVVAWVNTLSVYSTWAVGAPGVVSPDARWGVSWMAGTNAAFTAAAIGAAADERFSPLWISIPEVGLMGAEAAFATVRAVQDEDRRGGWIALAAWSGALTVHGVASIVAEAVGLNQKTPPHGILPPPEPPPPPPPDPLRVPEPVPDTPEPPARPQPDEPPPPVLVPAPVGDGAGIGPGLAVMGVF